MWPFTREQIAAEYNAQFSSTEQEFDMVKWGSNDGMYNRFRLMESLVDFPSVRNFLDIGCGTGAFIRYLCDRYRFENIVGIDISDKLITYCEEHKADNEHYFNCDISAFRYSVLFDAVSLIGVLQKSNVSPKIILKCISALMAPHGVLFFTTKNVSWEKFKEPGFLPESDHMWFRPEELEDYLVESRFRILSKGGFLPRENQIVGLNESHSVFYLVENDN